MRREIYDEHGDTALVEIVSGSVSVEFKTLGKFADMMFTREQAREFAAALLEAAGEEPKAAPAQQDDLAPTRDEIALEAMRAIIAKHPPCVGKDDEVFVEVAAGAYAYADAMLAERKAR